MTAAASSPAPAPLRLTARTPEDLIAVAAVVLGFRPRDSVVMLTFDAPQPFHARVDMPADAAAAPAVAALLVDPARRHRVQRVVLLVVTEDERLGRATWRALRAAFGDQGVEVAEALRVGDARWHPLLGGDQTLRETGVAYDVTHHPFLVRAVVEGRVTHGSRSDLAATLEPAPDAVEQVRGLSEGRVEPCSVPELLCEGAWVESLVAHQLQADGHAGGTVPPDDAEVARLLSGMRALEVRDAAWSATTRPRARAAVAFWTDVVRRSPPELLAAPAALLAWSAWQAGDGALAWCALDRCTGVDPGYRLAKLVTQALEVAAPPTIWDEDVDWRAQLLPDATG